MKATGRTTVARTPDCWRWLLDAALRLEVRYSRVAFGAADRAVHDVRHGGRDRRVDESEALSCLALDVGEGVALGSGHEEEGVHPEPLST